MVEVKGAKRDLGGEVEGEAAQGSMYSTLCRIDEKDERVKVFDGFDWRVMI